MERQKQQHHSNTQRKRPLQLCSVSNVDQQHQQHQQHQNSESTKANGRASEDLREDATAALSQKKPKEKVQTTLYNSEITSSSEDIEAINGSDAVTASTIGNNNGIAKAGTIVGKWTEEDVVKWLGEIHLSQYATNFLKHHIDGQCVLQLSKEDMCDIGISSVGHRSRLALEIEKLRRKEGLPPSVQHVIKKIAIEGNIAAGKSTFLSMLEKSFDFVVVPEPVSKWQQVSTKDEMTASQQNGGNLLQMFYDDPSRWGFTFQSYAFVSRMRSQLQPLSFYQKLKSPKKQRVNDSPATIQFFERSVYSDRLCFAQNCFESEIFSDIEWNVYCDAHDFLTESFSALKLHGMIYLRTDPKTCHKRLTQRGREEEKAVSLEYLESIHQKHEAWLLGRHDNSSVLANSGSVEEIASFPTHVDLRGHRTPLLVLDAAKEFEKDNNRAQELFQKVTQFVEQL